MAAATKHSAELQVVYLEKLKSCIQSQGVFGTPRHV